GNTGGRLAAGGIEHVRRNHGAVSVGHAQDPRGNPDVYGATGRNARAENGGCDSQDAAAAIQDSPLPLERRVNVDSDGREETGPRVRESHQPSRAGHAAALPGWHQRNRAALSLRLDHVREQGRATGGESLRNRYRRTRKPTRDRAAHSLGGRPGDRYRRGAVTVVIRGGTVVLPTGQRRVDIAVENGLISSIATELGDEDDGIDATELVVLPGMIDRHVHFN